jgi:hypothetical protein
MESAPDTLYFEFVDLLRSHLSRPVGLDRAAADFVAATCGDAETETLKILFSDPQASEAESLLEFLLFPDIEFQIQIEPIISRLSFEGPLERRLHERLSQPPIALTLELECGPAGGGETLRLLLPDDLLERFLSRLNLAKRWPTALTDSLDKQLPPDDRLRARVMLRNGPPSMGDAFAALCADLVEALSPRHRDFWPALALVIHLAPQLEAGDDPFTVLTAHKQRAFQMLEQQREFEHRLRRSNIETLLGQGQRVPTLGRAEARKQMRVVDAVCQSVFGRTTYFQPAAFD